MLHHTLGQHICTLWGRIARGNICNSNNIFDNLTSLFKTKVAVQQFTAAAAVILKSQTNSIVKMNAHADYYTYMSK